MPESCLDCSVIADSQVVTHACAKGVMVLTLASEPPGGVPLVRLSGTIEQGESSENLVSAIRRLLDAGSHVDENAALQDTGEGSGDISQG